MQPPSARVAAGRANEKAFAKGARDAMTDNQHEAMHWHPAFCFYGVDENTGEELPRESKKCLVQRTGMQFALVHDVGLPFVLVYRRYKCGFHQLAEVCAARQAVGC